MALHMVLEMVFVLVERVVLLLAMRLCACASVKACE